TLTNTPSAAEAWATIGAGTRVAANEQAGFAFGATETVPGESGTAVQALERRGVARTGGILVVGVPATERLNHGKHLSSQPGALGAALQHAHKRTGVVGNGDGGLSVNRPAAAAVMDST